MKEAATEAALLCRIEPLQSEGLPGRHGLKGIFEQQSVTALRAFKCADIAKYSVQRIRGTHHSIFALGAVGPGHIRLPRVRAGALPNSQSPVNCGDAANLTCPIDDL
jgi:hypothetical protein